VVGEQKKKTGKKRAEKVLPPEGWSRAPFHGAQRDESERKVSEGTLWQKKQKWVKRRRKSLNERVLKKKTFRSKGG